MKTSRFQFGLNLLAALGAATLCAQAADRYWAPSDCNPSAGGAGTWDNGVTANWSPNSTGGGCVSWVNANSDNAIFLGSASYAVTVSGNKTVNKIYRLPGGTFTTADNANLSAGVTITFAGANAGVDCAANSYLTLSCNFSGTLIKTGAGRLECNNADTTAKFVLNGGMATFAAANRFGTATGSDFLTFDGGGLGIGWASTSTSKTLASNKGIKIKAGGAFFGASAAPNDLRIESPIIDGSGGTGTGGLNVTTSSPLYSPYAAGGVVILANATTTANSYKGPTTVASNCKIVLGANNQIPDDSVLTLATGGTVDFAGYSDTVKSLTSSGGGSLILGAGTLTLANPNGESAGSAAISGSGGKIVMSGGTWNTSSGSCTYDGGFTLNGGTLYLRGNTALGTGKFTINSGATRVAVAAGSADRTISVPVDLAGNIIFGEAGRNTIIFQTGAWTLKGGDRQITADTVTTTINSAIGDEGAGRGLIKAGSGTLVLGGDNTYTGNTSVSAGTLQIGAGGTSGSVASGSIVNNAALLFNRSDALTYSGVISGSGTVTKLGAGMVTLSGNNTYTGGTTISAGTLQIGAGGTSGSVAGNIVNNAALLFNRSDALTYSGVISGSGTVTKLGAGMVTLSGNNTYTGGTTISAGTLQIGAGGTSGSVAGNIVNNAALLFNRSDALTYSGVISGTGSVTQQGSGTLTLGGANTYSGNTTISAGTLQIGAGGTSGSVAGNIVNNAALVFNRSDALTYSGVISGTGSVTQQGSGTLTLGGANTYSGNTTISAGTLALGASGSIANSPVISVAGGAVFDVSGVSGGFVLGSAQTLTGNGTVNGAMAINGTVAPGASVGTLTTGDETWNGGGKYAWDIADADTAGGWDTLNAGGNTIDVTATPSSRFTLQLRSLSGSSPGAAADFDADVNYTWQIASAGSVDNFDAGDFEINDTAFVNDLKGGTFAVEADSGGVNLKFVRNQAPTATARNVVRPLGATVKIKVADLLAENTSDPDGDARQLVNVGVDTPPGAGTVSEAGGIIFYVPTDLNSTVSDSFSFKVRDARTYRSGDTVRTAVANINISTVAQPGGQVGPIDTSGGAVTVHFSGIPGYRYDVERSPDLSAWTVVDTITAPANGQFSYQDNDPPPGQAYYRLKYNPPTP